MIQRQEQLLLGTPNKLVIEKCWKSIVHVEHGVEGDAYRAKDLSKVGKKKQGDTMDDYQTDLH